MKKNTTKRSLALSVLSLVLCVAMLLGTTFAWFTDSVTSGKNQIVAGNLDVELTHSNAKVTTPEDVQDSTDLFKFEKVENSYKEVLWEPGMVVYENFTVSNVGNLALKYALSLNVFDKNTYNGKDLTEVIKVAVIENGFSGDRAAAQALSFATLADFQKTGNLAAGDTTGNTFGVVLYWEPTDHDNDYNVNNYTGARPTSDGQPLFVEFGVNLVATQDTVEADSFDKYYDKNATFTANATATAVAGEVTKFVVPVTPSNEGGSTTVTFPADVLTGENSMTVEASPVATANNKFTVNAEGAVGAIDLTVKNSEGNVISEFKDGDDKPVAVTVETYVAKNLTNVSLQYNNGEGVQPTDVTYDKTTGKLSFKTPHFSTFVLGANEVAYVESNNTAYLTVKDAITAAQANDTVVLLKNITDNDSAGTVPYTSLNAQTPASALIVTKGLTINGSNHKFETTLAHAISITGSNIDVNLNNITVNAKTSAVYIGEDVDGTSLAIDGSRLHADSYTIRSGNGSKNLTINLNKSTVEGWSAFTLRSSHSTITVKDSDLLGDNDTPQHASNNYATIVFDGASYAGAFASSASPYHNNPGVCGSDNTMNIYNTKVTGTTLTANTQVWLNLQYGTRNNTITVDEKSILSPDSTWHYTEDDGKTTNTVKVAGENKEGTLAD